jgi:hypothetical protein
MTIKFYHPPTGTANPFHDFDPQNRAHYFMIFYYLNSFNRKY